MQIYEEILRLDRSFNVFLIFCGGSGIFDDNGKNGKNGDWLYGLKKTEIHPLKSMGALPWCQPSAFVL